MLRRLLSEPLLAKGQHRRHLGPTGVCRHLNERCWTQRVVAPLLYFAAVLTAALSERSDPDAAPASMGHVPAIQRHSALQRLASLCAIFRTHESRTPPVCKGGSATANGARPKAKQGGTGQRWTQGAPAPLLYFAAVLASADLLIRRRASEGRAPSATGCPACRAGGRITARFIGVRRRSGTELAEC